MVMAAIVFLTVPPHAQAIDGLKMSGNVGATNKLVVRGQKQGITDDVIAYGNAQAELWFVRVGGDVKSVNLDNRSGTVAYGGFAEGFVGLWEQELRLGLKTADDLENGETEIYAGVSGALPWGLGYAVTGYRSNQTNDVWVDLGATKILGDFTVGVDTAFAQYDETISDNGLELVKGSLLWRVPESLVSGVNFELEGGYTHPLGDSIIGGVTSTDHATIDARIRF